MNGKKLFAAMLVVFSCGAFAVTANAADDAIKTMAKILSHINHFPSPAEKATLNGIANDANSSAHVRAIATAMANMQHSVSTEDKAKLQEVVNDAAADQHTKDLATILINFSHTPSGDDTHKLHGMME